MSFPWYSLQTLEDAERLNAITEDVIGIATERMDAARALHHFHEILLNHEPAIFAESLTFALHQLKTQHEIIKA
uniref:Uncharacterized protein n=1 Tax=Serratia marcescens TaxID=615 RepID=A0A1C3HHP3_SERMA|nr:Uncharacterised protein [Serratia marcescens]